MLIYSKCWSRKSLSSEDALAAVGAECDDQVTLLSVSSWLECNSESTAAFQDPDASPALPFTSVNQTVVLSLFRGRLAGVWASLVAQLVMNSPAMQETWVRSLGWENPWRKAWSPTPFLPGESHGQRSLVGYSPWGRKQSDMTE